MDSGLRSIIKEVVEGKISIMVYTSILYSNKGKSLFVRGNLIISPFDFRKSMQVRTSLNLELCDNFPYFVISTSSVF